MGGGTRGVTQHSLNQLRALERGREEGGRGMERGSSEIKATAAAGKRCLEP